MAQNVGPILNMVTEKYLLRRPREWEARQEALRIFDADRRGGASRRRPRDRPADDRRTGRGRSSGSSPGSATASPRRSSPRPGSTLGDDFWGFLMLGGMSGGGMGFFVAPRPSRRLPRRGPGDHAAGQGRPRRRPAVRDGAGRLRLRDQPPRHLRRAADRARRDRCRPATTRSRSPG